MVAKKKERTYFSFDKGYDAKEIYQELHALDLEPIIPLKSVPKNERSSMERVNAYLKENYQLNDTRFYKAITPLFFTI